jgi:hypothetical protein
LKGNLVLSQCAVAMELLSYQQICGQIAEQIVLVTSFCILFQCTGLLKKHLACIYDYICTCHDKQKHWYWKQ